MSQTEPGAQSGLLSVVVALVSDTLEPHYDLSHLEGCLDALERQVDPPALQVIVPYPAQVKEIEPLKRRRPQVEWVPVYDLQTYGGQGGSREHHDELRARGLAAARGELVGLLEDHARPAPDWCRQAVAAHQSSYAGVGGAIENGIDRPLNWAVYFCDFGRYQNPLPAGESAFASDANVAYKGSALIAIRPVWQRAFHETEVNAALHNRGEKLSLSPGMIVYQQRKNLSLYGALKERFIWGRSYAATRSTLAGTSRRLVYTLLSPLLPAILVARMALNVRRKGRAGGAFLKALPLILLLTVFWSIGELVGTITLRTGSSFLHTYSQADTGDPQ